MGEDHTRVWIPGDRIIGGHLEAGYHSWIKNKNSCILQKFIYLCYVKHSDQFMKYDIEMFLVPVIEIMLSGIELFSLRRHLKFFVKQIC